MNEGSVFNIDLMNPNPTARKGKEGPTYRVSFEVQPDDWQMFMTAELAGMVLSAQITVVAMNAPLPEKPAPAKHEPPKPASAISEIKAGRRSGEAVNLCENPAFWAFLSELADKPITSAYHAGNALKQYLGIESRKILEVNDEKWKQFRAIKNEFERTQRAF